MMRPFGFFGAAAGAIIAALSAKSAHDTRQPFAPTPRKPGFKRRRRIASARRAKARAEAAKRFQRQLRKEREIGIDPIHLHSVARRFAEPRDAWLKKSKQWDRGS